MGNILPFVFCLLILISYHDLVVLVLSSAFPTDLSCEADQYNNMISCGGRDYFLKFPLTNLITTYQVPVCGLWTVNCSHHGVPRIQNDPPKYYSLETAGDLNRDSNSIIINDTRLASLISDKNGCHFIHMFQNFTRPYTTEAAPSTSFVDFSISPNMTVYKCPFPSYTNFHQGSSCLDNMHVLFSMYPPKEPIQPPPDCLPFVVPVVSKTEGINKSDLSSLLASEFTIQLHVSEESEPCSNECHSYADIKRRKKIILATVLPGGFLIMVLILILIHCQRTRLKKLSSHLPFSRKSPSATELVGETPTSEYFGVPVFTYEELEKATKNFDPSRELGDGGFGAVYHGKLRDGREVAVKRLYQHNYKRVLQFMNEVEILTGLRHPNLVTLYGCTSRHSRELLLVYEYISNGTVADHLHGELAEKAMLNWPIRLKVAIETAEALSFLHHRNIIHRDVKTTNILLDSNFSVKVADFGLSRPLPKNVSHVSTAPQGTPGYVDPEYYQCYQLTDKSDVYSFGVVLVELISSMPAVDIGRHRHEINLANLAINRIQDCAFDGLIDPNLGYKMDQGVNRMTTSVAELAFQCLQYEKDFRPNMDQVVKSLKEIRDYKDVHKSSRRSIDEFSFTREIDI